MTKKKLWCYTPSLTHSQTPKPRAIQIWKAWIHLFSVEKWLTSWSSVSEFELQLCYLIYFRANYYYYYYYYYYLLPESFSHQRWLMVFHWSLSDSKSPQFLRTLLGILADLNNAVVWMVSLVLLFPSPCTSPLVTVPKAPITTNINVTFMFHSFFQFPSKFEVFIPLFIFFQFFSVVSRDSKFHNFASSLFLLIIIRSSRLAEIKWSVCMSKSRRSLCVILQDRCWVVHRPFVHMVKFKFLAQFPVDYFSHSIVSSFIFGNLLRNWWSCFPEYQQPLGVTWCPL